MVVIEKRRLYIVLVCLICFFAFFEFQGSNMENETAIATVALPVESKVIILDAGHGNPDGGATSASGISEANINLQITLKVQKLLEQNRSKSNFNKVR